LGLADNVDRTAPLSTPSYTVPSTNITTNWKQVSCGHTHIAAVKTDGTLWTWGANASGQLGNGATVSINYPIGGFTMGVNWKQVSAGFASTAGIVE
jgi:alpha-tubulin suppressor-like RCC1 family protein